MSFVDKIKEREAHPLNVCVQYRDHKLFYSAPSQTCYQRAATLLTKEAETIAWIEGFGDGDVLLDIGANVGTYTIFAAVTRRATVFAVEPEAQNYAVLNRNIALNKLNDRVLAYCAAVADVTKFSVLHVQNPLHEGGSLNSFGQSVDYNLRPAQFGFRQGAISTTIDAMIAGGMIAPPRHIKIDVDGIEHLIVQGARETLARPDLKSVLIELNTNLQEHRDIIGAMTAAGFTFSEEQVQQAMRKDGAFKGNANHVFKR